MSDTIG